MIQYSINGNITDDCYDSTVVSLVGVKEFYTKAHQNRVKLIERMEAKKKKMQDNDRFDLSLKIKEQQC